MPLSKPPPPLHHTGLECLIKVRDTDRPPIAERSRQIPYLLIHMVKGVHSVPIGARVYEDHDRFSVVHRTS